MLSRSAIYKYMKWPTKQQQHELSQPPEQHRADKLAQIGQTLRQKRQEKKLTLEQVQAQTRIQPRFLQAIEAGQLDHLPEPVYIQGFIKKYAEILGLDGAELARSFPVSDRTKPTINSITTNLPAAQLQTSHLYLLYILVIVGTVSALSHILNRSDLQVSSQIQPQPPISATAKPKDKIKPVIRKPSTANKSTKPVEIGVTVKSTSWIRVVADGKKQFEGELSEGTQRTWAANEQLTMRVGNAGGVLVTTVDHKEAKPLGQLGQVQEITFGANNTRL